MSRVTQLTAVRVGVRTHILLIPKSVFLPFHGGDSQRFRAGYAVLKESIKKNDLFGNTCFSSAVEWSKKDTPSGPAIPTGA